MEVDRLAGMGREMAEGPKILNREVGEDKSGSETGEVTAGGLAA
jgi:hypothetical protein